MWRTHTNPDGFSLGPALLQQYWDRKVPDTFRASLLKRLDSTARRAVSLTCKTAFYWVLCDWEDASLTVKFSKDGTWRAPTQVLEAGRAALARRGAKPTSLVLTKYRNPSWSEEAETQWMHALSALASAKPRPHLALVVQLDYIPSQMFAFIGVTFPGLQRLSLSPPDGTRLPCPCSLPHPSALPTLRHLTIGTILFSSSDGTPVTDRYIALWGSVAQFLSQLVSLSIFSQPECVQYIDTLFQPASTPTTTLTSMSLATPLSPHLSELLRQCAPQCARLAVPHLCAAAARGDGLGAAACSWHRLQVGAAADLGSCFLPLPTDGKLVIEWVDSDGEIVMDLPLHDTVVQKLQRLDFSGCNTVRVQAAACAAASQPDALAAAVPALAAAQAPGVELVLCDLTLSPALTNSVRAAAAAGWQKASMYRVRLPADAPTAALPHATGSMVELTSLHPTPHMLVPAAAVVYSPYPPYVYTVGVPAVYHPMFQASGAAMPATQPPGLTTATLAYAHVASLQSAVPPAQLPRLQAAGLAAGTTQPYAPVPPAAGPTASAAAAATSAAAAAPTAPAAAQPTAQLPPLHTLSLHGPLTDTVLERLLPFVSPIDQFYAPELQLQLAVPDGVALPWRRLPAGRLQLSDWLPQAYLLGPSAGWKIECLDICLPLEMLAMGGGFLRTLQQLSRVRIHHVDTVRVLLPANVPPASQPCLLRACLILANQLRCAGGYLVLGGWDATDANVHELSGLPPTWQRLGLYLRTVNSAGPWPLPRAPQYIPRSYARWDVYAAEHDTREVTCLLFDAPTNRTREQPLEVVLYGVGEDVRRRALEWFWLHPQSAGEPPHVKFRSARACPALEQVTQAPGDDGQDW